MDSAPNITTDISSPEYFSTTFKVDAAMAADLSRQARFVDVNKGGGITAEAPAIAAPVAPSAPAVAPAAPGAPAQAAPLSARAEFDQLWADRSAGKISNFEWNDAAAQAHRDALVERIANGGGAQPAPVALVAQPTAFDAHFAPPAAPADYKFPYGEGTPTDEQIASDSALKTALHAEALPKSMVESIATNLRSAVATLANETPAQMQVRLDGNKARMSAMWAKEGITFDQAMQTIDAQLEQWSKNATLRPIIENAARFLTPIDLDAILQFAKHRGAKA